MSCWTIRATCYIVVVSCITSKVDYFCNTKLQQRENRGNRLKRDQNIDSSSPARLVKELLCDISLRGSLLSSCNWNCRECFRLSTLLLTLIFHGSLAHLRLEIWPVWVNKVQVYERWINHCTQEFTYFFPNSVEWSHSMKFIMASPIPEDPVHGKCPFITLIH